MINICSFDDIVGNETLIYGIKNMLYHKTFPPFCILLGPMGIGKTSIAKLIANSIMESSSSHINQPIIQNCSSINLQECEKNYLKNTPINPIVLIFEEFHALSIQAQTSFLTMVDNKPNNVYIIATTTEKQDLLKTILSRATIFEFKLLSNKQMEALLNTYLHIKNISFSQSICDALIYKSGGIPRHLLKYVDFILSGDFKDDQIKDLLNFVSDDYIYSIFISLKTKSLSFVTFISDLYTLQNSDKLKQFRDFWVRFLLCYKGADNFNLNKSIIAGISNLYSEAEIKKITDMLLKSDEDKFILDLIKLNLIFTNTSEKNLLGEQIASKNFKPSTLSNNTPINKLSNQKLSLQNLKNLSLE